MESIINELAKKDNFTNNKQYNSGLRLIRKMGGIAMLVENMS